jgi:hypothetical protein
MSKNAKIIQAVLLFCLVVVGIRLYFIFRERRADSAEPVKHEAALDPDYYVVPKKLHPQGLKDAKELTQRPVWVREGYRSVYYPYGPPVNFNHEAGRLGPIEKLQILDVIVQPAPHSAGNQVMAIFSKDGKRYAFSIGSTDHGSYQIFSDDLLFIQDPHELYKHWPPGIWASIENHEIKPGMNELQASFAVGVGIVEGSGLSNPRVVDYPNDGKPLRVTFDHGRATEVTSGK